MWSSLHKGIFYNRPLRSKRNMYDDDYDDDDFLGVNDFLLREPVTRKLENENKYSHSNLEIGHSSMQGYRKSMEDKHIIDDFPSAIDHTLVAIMDGHSGVGAATLTSQRLRQIIEDTLHWKSYIKKGKLASEVELISKALIQALINMDDELRQSTVTNGSGCTCVCAVITPIHIICANVGDSRCVIGAKDKVISMSEDHKPSLPDEAARIVKAGGKVLYDRVNGELAMSRALGDFQYKKDPTIPATEQLVICIPDIAVHTRSKDDEILVLACDGVWDVMSNADSISFLSDVVTKFGSNGNPINGEPDKKKAKLAFKSIEATATNGSGAGLEDERLRSQDMAEALIDLALVSGSMDNISSIVVRL